MKKPTQQCKLKHLCHRLPPGFRKRRRGREKAHVCVHVCVRVRVCLGVCAHTTREFFIRKQAQRR